MCLVIDDDSSTHIRDGWRTARVEHRCSECRRTIDPRERYWYQTSIDHDQNRPITMKMCAHCRGTITLGARLTGCPEQWYWGAVHDTGSDEGFVYDIVVHHDLSWSDRKAMMRTVAGRRRLWRTPDGSLLPIPA